MEYSPDDIGKAFTSFQKNIEAIFQSDTDPRTGQPVDVRNKERHKHKKPSPYTTRQSMPQNVARLYLSKPNHQLISSANNPIYANDGLVTSDEGQRGLHADFESQQRHARQLYQKGGLWNHP